MNCKKCDKPINLSETGTYNFVDDINRLTIVCSSCKNTKERIYPIGFVGLGIAAIFLAILYISNNLIFGIITIILALFAIIYQLFMIKD